jgi:hypothetical protein
MIGKFFIVGVAAKNGLIIPFSFAKFQASVANALHCAARIDLAAALTVPVIG